MADRVAWVLQVGLEVSRSRATPSSILPSSPVGFQLFLLATDQKLLGCASTPSCPRQPHHSAQGSVGTYLHPCCNVILSASDSSLSGPWADVDRDRERNFRTSVDPTEGQAPTGWPGHDRASCGEHGIVLRELVCQKLAGSHLHWTTGRGQSVKRKYKSLSSALGLTHQSRRQRQHGN